MKLDLQFAYAAGIIDGEGCLSIRHDRKNNSFLPSVQVNMTAIKPLRKLQGLFSGSLKSYKRDVQNWSTVHHYDASSKTSASLIESVYPYLIEKRPQADVLLALRKDIDKWNSKPRQRGNLPAAIVENRRSLKLRVHELNSNVPMSTDQRPRPLSKRETLAYMAGLLEAEGCFAIHHGKGNCYYATITVAMCCRAVVEEVRNVFGGTVIEIKPSSKNKSVKFAWRVKGQAAADVCRAVMPYLTFKIEEAELLRNLQNTTNLWAKRVGRGGMPEHITRKREQWRQRLMEIHKPAAAETNSEQPIIQSVSDSPIFTELSGEGATYQGTMSAAV